MAATAKALGTTELLEAVLLQLPMKDLLLAQRVSRTWRDAIKSSISLQRALFLAPSPADVQVHAVRDPARKVTNMDREYFFDLFALREQLKGEWKWLDQKRLKYTVTPNPVLARLFSPWNIHGFDYLVPHDLLTRDETWRQMYITAPACSSLTIHYRLAGPETREVEAEISGSDGIAVTFGDLLNCLAYDLTVGKKRAFRFDGEAGWEKREQAAWE